MILLIINLIPIKFLFKLIRNGNPFLCMHSIFSTGRVEFLQISGVQHSEKLAPLSIKGANQGPLEPLELHGNIVSTQNPCIFSVTENAPFVQIELVSWSIVRSCFSQTSRKLVIYDHKYPSCPMTDYIHINVYKVFRLLQNINDE